MLLWLLSVEEVKERRMEGWESALAVGPLTVKYLPWQIATRSPWKWVFLTNHASHFTHFCMKSSLTLLKNDQVCTCLRAFSTANIHVEEGQSCPMAEWQNSTIIRSGRERGERGDMCAMGMGNHQDRRPACLIQLGRCRRPSGGRELVI